MRGYNTLLFISLASVMLLSYYVQQKVPIFHQNNVELTSWCDLECGIDPLPSLSICVVLIDMHLPGLIMQLQNSYL